MNSFTSHALKALALAVCASAVFAVGSASAALPVIYSGATGIAGVGNPTASPAGANDWNCKPSAAHPRPVVLVHGTFANMGENWNTLSPLLKNEGYCVFALTYGATSISNNLVYAIGPVANSAAELSAFVDRVLAATHAGKVDIVGHSQGGMMPNYYIKFLGGAAKTNAMIGLAPDNHGTDVNGLLRVANLVTALFPSLSDSIYGALNANAPGLTDQKFDSAFIKKLNSVPDTVPGVKYTVISTRYDTVVTPTSSQALAGAKQIYVQDKCVLDFADHIALAFDHIALREVLNALDPAHARGTLCTPVAPGLGG